MTGDSTAPLQVRDLTAADLSVIATWAYDGPWSVYDADGELDPTEGYWAVVRTGPAGDDELIGFLCLGVEARGRGMVEDQNLIDLGVGMRPALVGRGLGAAFGAAAVEFAVTRAGDTHGLRAVVQDWNTRSLRLTERLGFRRTGTHVVGEVTFVVLERSAHGERPGEPVVTV